MTQFVNDAVGNSGSGRFFFWRKNTASYKIKRIKEQRNVAMEEKKKKGKWDQKSLQTAIDKILSKELSLGVASLRYNIPRSTLHDKVSALKRGEEVTLQPKIGRFTNTFSPEYEQVLVNHVNYWIQCSSCHGWAHEECAAIPESSDDYICDRCHIF